MRRLLFQVAVGPKKKLYERCIESAAAYCDRFGIDHKVLREPILKIRPLNSHRSHDAVERMGYLPIYEKENAFGYLGEYDQVAIVDADVYIRPSAPDIFDEVEWMQEEDEDEFPDPGGWQEPPPPPIAFAGVIEQSAPITEKYARKLVAYTKGQYGPLDKELRRGSRLLWRNSTGADFFNMGVMVVTKELIPHLWGQTPEEFLRRPAFERFINGEKHWKWSTDQTLLNYWLRFWGIPTLRLDWQWNALYGALEPYNILDAHFVHFFLSDHLPKGGDEIDELIAGIEG